jgi:hypothetical protein
MTLEMLGIVAVLLLTGAEPTTPMNCPEPPIVVGQPNEEAPPVEPPKVVKQEYVTIPPDYRERKIEVEVTIQGTIDIDGNVGDFVALGCKAQKRGKPVEGDEKVELCRDATKLLEDTYRKWKYEPATKRGEPVCSYYVWRWGNKNR